MSDMNMAEVDIQTFTRLIREALEEEDYAPMIGIGKCGVGKTVSIHELTQELGIGYRELRLVTLTEVDMLGLPQIKHIEGSDEDMTTYAANKELPRVERDGEVGILVLDEITSAQRGVRAAAYQLLDSKRALGEYHLPPKWKVIALGNGEDDGGSFEGMEAAFLSRGMAYRIGTNVQCWSEWATKHGLNPSVIAYVKFSPEHLHKFNEEELASVFPCPRTWEKLSTKLTAREARNGGKKLNPNDVRLYAAGAIGNDISVQFATFYEFNTEAIDPEIIMSGKATGKDLVNKREVLFLTIESLTYALNEKFKKHGASSSEAFSAVANTFKWAISLEKINLDFSIQCISQLSASVSGLDAVVLSDEFEDEARGCPEFFDFANRHSITFVAQ